MLLICALDFYSFTLRKKIAFHSVWHSCIYFTGVERVTVLFFYYYYVVALHDVVLPNFFIPCVSTSSSLSMSPLISFANFFGYTFLLLVQISVSIMNNFSYMYVFLVYSTTFFLSHHMHCCVTSIFLYVV